MKVKPAEEVKEFLSPIVASFEAELVDVEWNFREKSLTLIIDREGGVDLDLLEKIHRAVDEPLDELDPTFGESYTLNCSSPGLDRPFKTARDYEKHLGEMVEVHLYAPVYGKKYHEGKLVSFDGKTVKIEKAEGEFDFPVEKTSKVCLLIEI